MKVMWSFWRVARLGMSGCPIYLGQRRCVLCAVVGGEEIAERKASSRREARAKVQVISPTLTDGLRQLAAKGAIDYLARPCEEGDVEGGLSSYRWYR